MNRARIPAVGERVQMGKHATAFRGVWGEVRHIDDSYVRKMDALGRPDGHDKTDIYIMTGLMYQGKRVMVKASPYELDGALEGG